MENHCGACDEFARISQLPALPDGLRPVAEISVALMIHEMPQLVVYACMTCGHRWTFNRADGSWAQPGNTDC